MKGAAIMEHQLKAFIAESNQIEGIRRDPSPQELSAASKFLALTNITIADMNEVQAVFAPNRPLRDVVGRDVRVGNHIAPRGGPEIRTRLVELLDRAMRVSGPWETHIAYETLHPYMDGNGRTGRLLWAWQMEHSEREPFALPFLHRFYYQTLEGVRGHVPTFISECVSTTAIDASDKIIHQIREAL